MKYLPSFATSDNGGSPAEHEPEPIQLAADETSLDFLQRVYRDPKQSMSRRMRAAIEALPHEHPRLGAVAVGHLNGRDFAAMLEKAIERSGRVRELRQIEGSAIDVTPNK